MTDLPPQDDVEPDWGNVVVLTQAQKDTVEGDAELKAAWRELPEGVVVGELAEAEQDDGSVIYLCAHPALQWDTAETLLEVADDPAVATEVKAERAKGGEWRAEARKRAKAAVAKRPKAERDAKRTKNKGDLDEGRKGKLKRKPAKKPAKRAAVKKANGAKRP